MAECDWRLPDCHSATWGTLRRRWQQVLKRITGYTLRFMAIQYCTVFSGRPRGNRDQWVRQLTAPIQPEDVRVFVDGLEVEALSVVIIGDAPPHWPRAASWVKHAPLWADIYARARLFVDGRLQDKCDGHPVHFGAGKELDRFPASQWRDVNCGNTGNQTFLERIE